MILAEVTQQGIVLGGVLTTVEGILLYIGFRAWNKRDRINMLSNNERENLGLPRLKA